MYSVSLHNFEQPRYGRAAFHRCLIVLLAVLSTFSLNAATFVETDICIYGATSGGVAASVQASRMGKRVVLISVNNHIGGMTSGGLSQTDTGNIGSIGGIAREFYRRVGQRYGATERFLFEPHIAEEVFAAMLSEARVPIYTNQRLASVTRDEQRIISITMVDGSIFYARMFIDTTYEGDLMAAAGVTFTVGREAISTYGESLAGARLNGNSLSLDPYVMGGDPSSGLLPLIQSGDGGAFGSADHRLQAYNFRLCLTQVSSNRLAIAPPANYSESRYELLARLIETNILTGQSVALNTLLYFSPLFNGKSDLNANAMISTDFVGANYTYPTNSYANRDQIWREHEAYQRGLLHFLATSTRVPASTRAEMQSWGLCGDEFQDTGGWPHQLYVREARRMVSDYVMQRQNCDGRRTASDSIALGSYAMDSHAVQRVAPAGYAQNEGSFFVGVPAPYPISYRSIVPRAGECENVFSTFALSASHVAFGSCRMEPVFMMTSQSAATAAAFAIDDNLPVQQVNYEKLRLQLEADRQLLIWATLNTTGVVDNADAGVLVTGSWTTSTSETGFIPPNYLHDGNAGKGTKSVRFTPNLPTNGTYEVYLRWTAHANRASNVPVDIIHAAGTNTVTINQQIQGSVWVPIATNQFESGTHGSVTVRNAGTTGFVVADAVWFKPVGFAWNVIPTVNIIATDPVAGEFQTNTARFTVTRTGPTNTSLAVLYNISGSATNGTDFATLSGSVTIPPGSSSAPIIISPQSDTLAENLETVAVHLRTNTTYALGAYSNATATLADLPIDAWRASFFTEPELADPSIGAPTADPDADGISNLREYLFALDPRQPNTAPEGFPRVEIIDGHFTFSYPRSKTATDFTINVEVSTDLNTWSPAADILEQTDMLDQGATWLIIMRDRFPTENRPQLFVRLRPGM